MGEKDPFAPPPAIPRTATAPGCALPHVRASPPLARGRRCHAFPLRLCARRARGGGRWGKACGWRQRTGEPLRDSSAALERAVASSSPYQRARYSQALMSLAATSDMHWRFSASVS